MGAPGNILTYWRLIEWLTPTSLPDESPQRDSHEPIYNIRFATDDALPWELVHPHYQLRCSSKDPGIPHDQDNEQWNYGVYAGLIDINEAREEIEDWLGEDPDHAVRDERQPQLTSAIGFQVDPYGNVIADTLVLSHFSWAFGILRQQSRTSTSLPGVEALTTAAFEAAEKDVYHRFANQLAGTTLTLDNLYDILDWLYDYLGLSAATLTPMICRIQCIRRPLPKAGSTSATDTRLTNTLEMLNSFFLDDLSRVASCVENQDIGDALTRYLGKPPKHQVDLRQAQDDVWRLFDPERFPPSRWPAKGRFPLVFSQQLAVNLVFGQPTAESQRLMGINGPPGTGKTTLLKDIVAGIIVQRAEMLAEFSSPSMAFGKTHLGWETSAWKQFFTPLDNRLHGFGIVVASSNNGAVENVTLEFPKADEVDEQWGNRSHSPFTAIASRLLTSRPGASATQPEQAWSLLAACLGNSRNRKAFTHVFWKWGRSDSNADEATVTELLKGGRPEGIPDWSQAVARFQRAMEKEKACRAERRSVYKAIETLNHAEQTLDRLRHQATSLKNEIHQAENDLCLAELEEVRCHQALEKAKQNACHLAAIQHHNAQRTLDTLSAQCQASKHQLAAVQAAISHAQRNGPNRLTRWLNRSVFRISSVQTWQISMEDLIQQQARASAELSQRLKEKALALEALMQTEQALAPRAINQAVGTEQEHYDTAFQKREQASHHLTFLHDQQHNCQASLQKNTALAHAARPVISAYCNQVGEEFCLTPQKILSPAQQKECFSPWADPEWEAARVAVFLAALDLHDSFVFEAKKPLLNNLGGMMQILQGKTPKDLPAGVAEHLWASLFLLVPVVSTTFASFGRQFSTLGRERLGWLLIDEAGQAAPQQAVGALWRSRRAVVVGDPLQLTPVVTVPSRLQGSLAVSLGVSNSWLPGHTSVQAVVDRASQYGSLIGSTWVGAPLLVHRRCDNPMFNISNQIAYDNTMVHGKSVADSDLLESSWLNIPPEQASGHWLPNEGRAAAQLIRYLLQQDVKAEDIFLISPFRSVVARLRRLAAKHDGIKAGTIHTVQGKEANIVILVLGGNPEKPGAKEWASSTPNLLNVAVSRAKMRLYVIGSRDDWAGYEFFNTCASALPSITQSYISS